jgi:hypothetical protein
MPLFGGLANTPVEAAEAGTARKPNGSFGAGFFVASGPLK